MTIAKPFIIAILVFLPLFIIDRILMYWLYKIGLEIKIKSTNIYDGFLGSQHTTRAFPYNYNEIFNKLLLFNNIKRNVKRLEKAAIALKDKEVDKKAKLIRFLANFSAVLWLLVLLLFVTL